MKLACVYILYGCLSAGENGALGEGCKILGVYAHRQTGNWEAERLHRTDGSKYCSHLFLIPYEVKQ